MTTKSSDLQVTLADAFDIGKKEGLKEAFLEIKAMLHSSDIRDKNMKTYVDARLKTILELSNKNPFKQKD